MGTNQDKREKALYRRENTKVKPKKVVPDIIVVVNGGVIQDIVLHSPLAQKTKPVIEVKTLTNGYIQSIW